ncbi:3'5'-cyclic nucleotide phosphodiesterase domain-containing protein [Toxoplasma gondii GAB2-2007-GAL-DOM2]|uniref:Phosphodiesterase n=5 Tax=Toxoplasma gondii TaxID=5811 RepID=B9QPM2_TOXGV|nr:3'5'-cyclic nucleotide phosphodiesterase domain-containing protein [Toxoplasma gondii VEG]KFG28531.1 3'5'-cyclic nucleotide phosphodiesterase domain-containing protein [Toxoplasma gondii p89]KFG32283.1 3'5'-cyclic nucleotide phosphodiesterase domain-containing protein [Toxoplasma gondii GAB2-2007-GAL-DOM2]CEL73568.1 TPA: 3',5'-cyclic phosphodiesterase, putative [Toxoplasma gondii VEG]
MAAESSPSGPIESAGLAARDESPTRSSTSSLDPDQQTCEHASSLPSLRESPRASASSSGVASKAGEGPRLLTFLPQRLHEATPPQDGALPAASGHGHTDAETHAQGANPGEARPEIQAGSDSDSKTSSSPLSFLTSLAVASKQKAHAEGLSSHASSISGKRRAQGVEKLSVGSSKTALVSLDEESDVSGADSAASVLSSQWASGEDRTIGAKPVLDRARWTTTAHDATTHGDASAETLTTPEGIQSPPLSCIVAVEEQTVPPWEERGIVEGVGVVKASSLKKSGRRPKAIHFREADSEVSAPSFSDMPSLGPGMGRQESDLEGRSNGEVFRPMHFSEDDEEEDEEETKRYLGRSQTGDPGWRGMRWQMRSMWRYVAAINNDEATMKNATGPYRVLRGCDCKCFPLAFKERRAECDYRNFNIRRMPLRLVIMFPVLCTIYAISYGTCRRFCPDCYLAAPFDGELVVSVFLLTVATLGAHFYLLYKYLELFVVLTLCLLSTYRSAMRLSTLAGAIRDPANFGVIFPYYGINGILESFLLCFTIVTFLGVRFAYAMWATLYFLAWSAPIAILSMHLSVKLIREPERVWSEWEGLLHILPFLLIVLTLVSAYYEERKKRVLFWNLRISDSRLKLLEKQVQLRRLKRRVDTGTPLDCILGNLSEALEALKRPTPLNREEIFALMQETINMLTTSENVYQVQAEYVDNDFTRSFIRDLRMHSREASDFAVSRLNTLATRRRSVISGRVETTRTELLEEIGNSWDVNMFMLRLKLPRPLVEVGYVLLSPFALSPDACLNTQLLRKFLCEVEKAYRNCPYHNSLHGSMVCHLSICLLEMLRLRESLGDLEEASLIIAALCHDIAHPGRNNNFMVNANTPLALTYNDISVLENMHASLTFKLLLDRRLGLLNHLHREAYRSFRMTVIELIMSTDMKTHFEQIANFRVRRQKEEFDPINNYDDRQKVMSMIIKSADIGHGTLPWADHERWCDLVVQEFYEQGDEEKRLGLPVSFLCDRDQHDREFFKSQVGFLDFVVKPLYEELKALETQLNLNPQLPIENICMKNLQENISEWKKKNEERRASLEPAGLEVGGA